MMESNQEQAPEEKALRPFGVGIPLESVQGSGASGSNALDPGSKGRHRSAGGKASRRPVTFTCAMGRVWPRSVSADLEDALDDLLGELLGDPVGDNNSDTDAAGEALVRQLRAALPSFQLEALGDLLGFFPEEQVEAATQHFGPPSQLGAAPSSVGEALALPPGAETLGPEVEAILLRPHSSAPFADFCVRLVELLGSGRPVVVLSDPTFPVLAEAAVDWILDAVPGAPLRLLHEDGLDVLRHAAAWPNLALELVEPEAGLLSSTASLRKIRGNLAQAQAEQAAAETAAREEDGWFGSGVVAAPLAPLWVRSSATGPWQVPADADPAEAAHEIVQRAYGPTALGGFAAGALCRVRIPALLFSRVTEALLARLDEVEEDPCFDPPGWILDAVEPSGVMTRAKRLGLDEGATLIFERRAAREDGKPYGMVFTNGEPRMRTSEGARVFGVLLLMRGDGPPGD